MRRCVARPSRAARASSAAAGEAARGGRKAGVSAGGGGGGFFCGECVGGGEEGGGLGGGGAGLFLRGHFAGGDAVVDPDPLGEIFGVGGVEGEGGEVEVALLGVGVVALEAVGLQELGWGGGAGEEG